MSDKLKIPDDLTQYYDDAKRRAAGRLSLEVQLIERVIALERAMREIKEVVHRRQLPITHQIWDIADAALNGERK